MPLDRCDAFVIGATVEGLACATALARAGRKVVCADLRADAGALGKPLPAWVAPAAAQALGLMGHGLRFAPAPAQIVKDRQDTAVIWPDPERRRRALTARDPATAEAFEEAVAAWAALRLAAADPGAPQKAMLAASALVTPEDGRSLDLGRLWFASIAEEVAWRLRDPLLQGALAMMAAERAPADPAAAGTAPGLLWTAPVFAGGGSRLVLGGQTALLAALVRAFESYGGVLRFDAEVTEVLMDKEQATGAALSSGQPVKAQTVVAALSPRRLSQGLLSTKRFGHVLRGLRSAPRDALALARFRFSRTPECPGVQPSWLQDGAEVRLGPAPDRLIAMAAHFARRTACDDLAAVFRFSLPHADGSATAIAAAPYVPGELAEGPWVPARRARLLAAFEAALARDWPEAAAVQTDCELLDPGEPGAASGTGAMFGGAQRLAEPARLFPAGPELPQPVLRGLYLCAAAPLEPDLNAGVLTAAAAAGAGKSKERA
jgi:phytoene dehydrogenase-like protein